MTITINDLTVTYDHHPAIHHLSATIAQGEWFGIVGPNGAGKSTLLKTMAGSSQRLPLMEESLPGELATNPC